jgi:phospho-N-acetylmuramoyl-pentapeptide-transferase
MLADLLYQLLPYQIFKSVVFRASLTFLTTYFLIDLVLPPVIRCFRRKGITADFTPAGVGVGPYRGATPIMGGAVLVPAIILSVLLWTWLNPFTISLLVILVAFAVIGGMDDFAKVIHKRKVESGRIQKKAFADKADGIRGDVRLLLEFLVAFAVLSAMYKGYERIDGLMHIPFIPMKHWFPEIPAQFFIPAAAMIVVGGANAVNLTDGLDSLATVPIISCSVFIAAAAYLAGDAEWSLRLKLLYIADEIKEVTIFAVALTAACAAFLKFNSPPASIYMGDIGSLGLGATVCTMFVFIKAELYLPIIGGTFLLAALSVILQRAWFKIALWRYDRPWAEKNRLFYRAPYHHHLQVLLTYRDRAPEIRSIWHEFQKRLGLGMIPPEDQYLNPEHINNKIIWKNHLRSVALAVIAAMIYFKVR